MCNIVGQKCTGNAYSNTDNDQLIQTAKESIISSFSNFLRNHAFLFLITFSWSDNLHLITDDTQP